MNLRFLEKIGLLKLCSVLFIIGIIALFLVVSYIKPENIEVKNIDNEDIGKLVTINAFVENKVLLKGNLFLDVTDDNESYIKVVMFENDIEIENLEKIKEKSYINIIGKVDKYSGRIEVIAKTIKVIS